MARWTSYVHVRVELLVTIDRNIFRRFRWRRWWRPVGAIKSADVRDMRFMITDIIRVLVLGHDELDKRTTLPVVSTEDFLQVQLPRIAGRIVPILLWAIRVPPPDN